MTEEIDYLPFENTTLQNHRRIVEQYGGIQNLIHIWEINQFNESKRWLDEYEKLSLQLEKSKEKRHRKKEMLEINAVKLLESIYKQSNF